MDIFIVDSVRVSIMDSIMYSFMYSIISHAPEALAGSRQEGGSVGWRGIQVALLLPLFAACQRFCLGTTVLSLFCTVGLLTVDSQLYHDLHAVDVRRSAKRETTLGCWQSVRFPQ